jgi:hypothetical protein
LTVGRKWPAIDVLRLYSRADNVGWNTFLTHCLTTQDVQGLKKTLYGVQAGMADLANQGPVDPKLTNWFLRIQRSLENTAKAVFRAKYPNPLDDPMAAKTGNWISWKEAKKKRDGEFEQFLRESRF